MTRPVSGLPVVLIVEDDKGIQELLRFTLVCGGYQPVCADTAEQMVETVRGAGYKLSGRAESTPVRA